MTGNSYGGADSSKDEMVRVMESVRIVQLLVSDAVR